jgi:hypothetical protein
VLNAVGGVVGSGQTGWPDGLGAIDRLEGVGSDAIDRLEGVGSDAIDRFDGDGLGAIGWLDESGETGWVFCRLSTALFGWAPMISRRSSNKQREQRT